jgi:hypothetical protein
LIERLQTHISSVPVAQRRATRARLAELVARHGHEVDLFSAHDPARFDELAARQDPVGRLQAARIIPLETSR